MLGGRELLLDSPNCLGDRLLDRVDRRARRGRRLRLEALNLGLELRDERLEVLELRRRIGRHSELCVSTRGRGMGGRQSSREIFNALCPYSQGVG